MQLLAKYLLRRIQGGKLTCSGLRSGRLHDLAQQVAQGIDAGNGFVLQSDPGQFLDFQRQVQPFQGVHTQIELRAEVRRQTLVRVAAGKPLPDLLRHRMLQQHLVLSAHLRGRHRPGMPGFRRGLARLYPVVDSRQQVSLELVQPGARQRLAGNGVIGNALV